MIHCERASTADTPDMKRVRDEGVRRDRLVLDCPRVCSVTLSTVNVYCCLSCGAFLKGKGPTTPAFRHAVSENHVLFLCDATVSIVHMLDGSLVSDPQYDDILYNYDPHYTQETASLLTSEAVCTPNGSFRPGIGGLQCPNGADWLTSSVMVVSQVDPIRNQLLVESSYTSPLVTALSFLLRQLWNKRRWTPTVSPLLLLTVVTAMEPSFCAGGDVDAAAFMAWLLRKLHKCFVKEKQCSAVADTLFGEVSITTVAADRTRKSTVAPFTFLSLDLPKMPLFQDQSGDRTFPQVPLPSLLSAFDGATTTSKNRVQSTMHVTRVPPFLVLHFRRFLRNHFSEEKNRALVTFPLSGLQLPHQPDTTQLDLIANLCHVSHGTAVQGTYMVHLLSGTEWTAVDSDGTTIIQKPTVAQSESYIQVWKQRTAPSSGTSRD